MNAVEIVRAAAAADDRMSLWTAVLNGIAARRACEVGVFRGEYAQRMLADCASLESYYLIDPWMHLDDWNKPLNVDDVRFNEIYQDAMARTEFAARKRVVLRGTTASKAAEIEDGSLDFVYIDGDHTLRGITIDLMEMISKVRPGGVIGGDDFTRSIWQHGPEFSPTEVFPYAIYFAEAKRLPIVTLPYNQFAIVNAPERGFEMIDLGDYRSLDVGAIYTPPSRLGTEAKKRLRRLRRSGKATIKTLLGR